MERDEFTHKVFMDNRVGIARQAIEYGGSFMCYLGEALYRADLGNSAKLYFNWTDEWFQYYQFYTSSLSKENK